MRGMVLMDFQHEGEDFVKDDVRTVDDETGAYFCSMGWFKDESGSVPTQEPNRGDITLSPTGMRQVAEMKNGSPR